MLDTLKFAHRLQGELGFDRQTAELAAFIARDMRLEATVTSASRTNRVIDLRPAVKRQTIVVGIMLGVMVALIVALVKLLP